MNKPISEVFDLLIDQDFNPDFIKLGLIDSYDIGKNVGLKMGIGISILAGTALTIGTINYIGGPILVVVKKERNNVRKED